MSAGARFWQALEAERPLQVVGTINAYAALLAEKAGFRAIYLSGAGVANASFGLPDLALTTLNDVCEDIRRISYATELPLLVDADTGWGGAFMIGRTVREMIRAGAAACHIEDQVGVKRCGHRPGKALVETSEMSDRIKAAVDGRTDDRFAIMARTDAHAVEGQQAALDRAAAYEPDGVRQDADVHGQRTRRCRYQHGALSAVGISGHVESRRERVRNPAKRRDTAIRHRQHADPRRALRGSRLSRLRGQARSTVRRKRHGEEERIEQTGETNGSC